MKLALLILPFLLLGACANQKPDQNYSSSGGASPNRGGGRSSVKSGMSSANETASSNAQSSSKSSSRGGSSADDDGGSGRAGAPLGASKTAVPKVPIVGTWSGVSNGEKIVLKVGNGGSASLTNSGGANSGEWAAGGSSGRFAFTFGGRRGDFVLLDSRTATLTVMGSTIELRR
jgi:hypothetical protein